MANLSGAKDKKRLSTVRKDKLISNNSINISRSIRALDGNVGKACTLNYKEMRKYVKDISRKQFKKLHPDTRQRDVGIIRRKEKFEIAKSCYKRLLDLNEYEWKRWCGLRTYEPEYPMPFIASWDREPTLGAGWHEDTGYLVYN